MMGKISNRRVLVTGGAGFIGSNLVDKLLGQENQVVCLDNLSTGKLENITHNLSNPAFKFIKGDLRNLETCREAVDGCSLVLHQGALGSVPRSITDPVTTNEVNISGFVNVVIAAKDAGVRRIVYASSSSVYGDSPKLPKKEEDTGRPLSPYAVTKSVNELYASVFSSTYNLEMVGLRYFNVFGPRQDPGGEYAAVIPKFIKALMHKKSPVINGDGSNSRDFTYIENVLQALELASTTTNPASLNTVYNVACGSQVTLNELFRAIKEELALLDKDIEVIHPVHGPNRPGDIPYSLASIEKACNLLGYSPTHTFQKGIRQAIAWYVKNIG